MFRNGAPAELSAGSHATLATRPRDPRLLPYVPPSPTFSLRARTSPPPSCDWASTNSIAGGQALPRRPPWLQPCPDPPAYTSVATVT